MDSSLIGVIIGGLIAVIPVVLNGFFETHRQRAQFMRDRALREIDLIDAPRLSALREYAYQLGAFLSDSSYMDSTEFSENKFIAAHARAAAFVAPETLKAMNAAYPVIISGWNNSASMSAAQKLNSPEIAALMRLLNAEMVLKCGNDPEDSARRIK